VLAGLPQQANEWGAPTGAGTGAGADIQVRLGHRQCAVVFHLQQQARAALSRDDQLQGSSSTLGSTRCCRSNVTSAAGEVEDRISISAARPDESLLPARWHYPRGEMRQGCHISTDAVRAQAGRQEMR
jgi:hypothetical protein